MRTFDLTTSRRNNFDAIRLFLAIAVIFGHSFVLQGHGDNEPLHRLSHGMTYSGSLAVRGFFIISGFLIARSWLAEPRMLGYLRKRILRIFPGYAAAAGVTILLVIPLSAGRWVPLDSATLRSAMQMEPMMSGYAFGHCAYPFSVNGSLWTIRYEFYCYLFAAACGILGLLAFRWTTLALAIGCAVLTAFSPHIPLLRSGYSILLVGNLGVWPGLISCFAVGMAYYQFRRVVPHSAILFWIGAIALLLLMRLGWPPIFLAFQPFLLGYILLYIAFSDRIRLYDAGAWGDFSYGVYLYAFPVEQLTIQWLAHPTPLLVFLIATPVSFALAVASWRLIERPYLRLKHRAKNSTPKRPAEAPRGGQAEKGCGEYRLQPRNVEAASPAAVAVSSSRLQGVCPEMREWRRGC